MTAARKTGTRKPPPAGPRALKGTPEARRVAAMLLQVLSGLKSTQEASDELGIALPRYYVLETRALQAMIDALEPRSRGRRKTGEQERQQLRSEIERLQRELLRNQAVHRTTLRALDGLDQKSGSNRKKPKAPVSGKKVRRVRKKTRGERILSVLAAHSDSMDRDQGGGTDEDRPAEQGSGARGRIAGSGGGAAASAGNPADGVG